jgi:hypothetical protein
LLLAVQKSLKTLRPDWEPAPSPKPSLIAEMDSLSGWMEHRHTLLLRTLIDGTAEELQLPGVPTLFIRVGEVIETLRKDTRLKFAEFREKWTTRLEERALLPFLQRNQWIVPHPEGGVALVGKGNRKEARMLYLQTLHDMSFDASRQWASIAGRLEAFQEQFATEWLRELPPEGNFRAPPVLEATLRAAEVRAWKNLRLSLPGMAEESFVRAVQRWDNRRFLNPGALAREVPEVWRKGEPTRNGFIGFMRAVSAVSERMTGAMLDHYERKWELLLRGFSKE